MLGLLPQQLNDVALRLRDGVGRSDGPLGLAGGTANPQVRVTAIIAAVDSIPANSHMPAVPRLDEPAL